MIGFTAFWVLGSLGGQTPRAKPGVLAKDVSRALRGMPIFRLEAVPDSRLYVAVTGKLVVDSR